MIRYSNSKENIPLPTIQDHYDCLLGFKRYEAWKQRATKKEPAKLSQRTQICLVQWTW